MYMFSQRIAMIDPPVSCPSSLLGRPFENVLVSHTPTNTYIPALS